MQMEKPWRELTRPSLSVPEKRSVLFLIVGMRVLVALSLCLVPLTVSAQSTVAAIAPPATNVTAPAGLDPQDYVCPMDADQRSDKPGTCPRCGMKLVLGIPDQVEFPMDVTSKPAVIQPGQKVQLKFTIRDPKTQAVVTHFEIVHEKLFHMFILSSDLTYFVHDHPVPQADGTFLFDEVFPKPGMYRVVADVYPFGGTPQLIARTVFVEGAPNAPVNLSDAVLKPDTATQHGGNTEVSLELVPPIPIAGTKTIMFVRLNTADGNEKWLGAWAHMLVASDDTVDMIHEHPFIADGGTQMQFNVIFPRAKTYRVWVQFQRKGVVNTVAFNIPVVDLEHAPQ
jgi:Heavy metal binding domain